MICLYSNTVSGNETKSFKIPVNELLKHYILKKTFLKPIEILN